eukprot:COSAG01_NODE_356_length_18316_cov_24.401493_11_plen_108_part_00
MASGCWPRWLLPPFDHKRPRTGPAQATPRRRGPRDRPLAACRAQWGMRQRLLLLRRRRRRRPLAAAGQLAGVTDATGSGGGAQAFCHCSFSVGADDGGGGKGAAPAA